jgi:hypothetical protein
MADFRVAEIVSCYLSFGNWRRSRPVERRAAAAGAAGLYRDEENPLARIR